MGRSVLIGRNVGEFLHGFFDGGLIAVEEALGTAKAFYAGDRLGDGTKGIEVYIRRHIGIVVNGLGSAIDEDVQERDLVMEFTLYIGIEGFRFFPGERIGEETMKQAVLVPKGSAAFALPSSRRLKVKGRRSVGRV